MVVFHPQEKGNYYIDDFPWGTIKGITAIPKRSLVIRASGFPRIEVMLPPTPFSFFCGARCRCDQDRVGWRDPAGAATEVARGLFDMMHLSTVATGAVVLAPQHVMNTALVADSLDINLPFSPSPPLDSVCFQQASYQGLPAMLPQ